MSKDKEKKVKEPVADKKVKEPVADNQENFILKKIRYYQGSIKDYDTFWNQKIAEGEREESPETKAFQKTNAELNKAFEIVPVEKDDTVICKDIVSGEDAESSNDNADAKPSEESEGTPSAPEKSDKEADKEGTSEKEEKKVKKVKKDDDDDDDDEKDDDDDDDDDKKKKKHKEED